jgi:hypothetical protein
MENMRHHVLNFMKNDVFFTYAPVLYIGVFTTIECDVRFQT